MDPLHELKQRARKDFDDNGIDEIHWRAFWIGYMAAIKRFGVK